MEFFHPYFRTIGANRAPQGGTLKKLTASTSRRHSRASTKPFFWPDAVFALRTSKKRVLCLLKVYRGIDTARVIWQLEWHLLALEHGLPSLQYGFTSANKVLLVFETEVALHAVLKRLLTRPGFEEFAPLIACSRQERLRNNFQEIGGMSGREIKGGGL